MKRTLTVCLAMFWAAALLLSCHARSAATSGPALDIDAIDDYRAIPRVTQEEIDAIERLKTENTQLLFGHLLETDSFRLPDGSFAGFTIEACALFSELFGIPFVPQYFESRDALIDALSDRSIDLTGCLSPTGERKTPYMSSLPLAGRDLNLYTSVNAPEIKSGAELAGRTVAFIGGAATKERTVAAYFNLAPRSIDVRSAAEAAYMLETGEIDALIMDSAADPQFEDYDFIRSRQLFWPVFIQVALSTGNPDLAPIISVVNKYLEAGGQAHIAALYDQGHLDYQRHKLFQSLTDAEKAYLDDLAARDASVPIALEHDNYPFSFYNEQDAQFEGVAVDVLAEIGRLTGIRFENTTHATTAWTEMLDNLKSGKVALVSHLIYSDERAKSYIWSAIPFSVDTYALISKVGFPQVKIHEIPALKTGAFTNSVYADIYRLWFPGSTNLVLFETASESFDALEKGEIDLVIGADFMMLAQTNYREKSGYVVNYRFDAAIDSAFGFNQNQTLLRDIVDKALAQITLEPISNYWSSRVFDYSAKMQQQRTSYISASAVILLFGLAAMSVLLFNNKRLTENLRARTVTLSDARQSLQTILDAVPLPIGILGKDTHRIVYGNDVFLDMMALAWPDELYQLDTAEIFRPIPAEDANPMTLEALLADSEDHVVGEMQLISAKNKAIDVRVHIRWSDYEGQRSAIAIMVDLTAEKEYQRILLAAAEHEKEANQAKSLFLANMSHEIRTPMNGIIGLTDLLLGEDISGRQLQYVKDIKTSAQSLLGIINDILDISKVSAGKLEVVPVDTDLILLLNNIVSMIGFSARLKGLSFIDDIRIDAPCYARLDDVRVRQIILNLLSNAVKFTREGSVKLTAWIDGDTLLFEVRDTGIGIKPENLSTVFGAFEQVDTLKNRKLQGTGLGLAITKSLVELMGGTIRVESEYGAGTAFIVSIPYTPGDAEKVERPDTSLAYISAPDARVLLVDDIPINLTVGSGILRLCAITPTVAASGAEAISLVQQQDFDLIFMDHMMPEMDGIEATGHIRALGGRYSTLPIIALTANAMTESRELLLKSGMDDFISKPIDIAAFMGILRKWLPPEKIQEIQAEPAKPEAYSALLDAAARIEGLDIERALGRIGGLQNVLETSLRQAARTIDGRLRSLDEGLLRGDLPTVALEAHGLKGMLASIGASHNAEWAAQIESAAKEGDPSLCAAKLPGFIDALEGLSLALNTLFAQYETDAKTDRPEGDRALLDRTVLQAIALLEDFEAGEATVCLRELEAYFFGESVHAALDEAVNLAESFNYEGAAAALNAILAQ